MWIYSLIVSIELAAVAMTYIYLKRVYKIDMVNVLRIGLPQLISGNKPTDSDHVLSEGSIKHNYETRKCKISFECKGKTHSVVLMDHVIKGLFNVNVTAKSIVNNSKRWSQIPVIVTHLFDNTIITGLPYSCAAMNWSKLSIKYSPLGEDEATLKEIIFENATPICLKNLDTNFGSLVMPDDE